MRAAEIDEEFPVDIDSSALATARMLAEKGLPGIVVLTAEGQLHAVLTASQVVGFMVPGYVHDDPLLAHVLTELIADGAAKDLGKKTIRQLLPQRQLIPPTADADDTIIDWPRRWEGCGVP